YDAGFAHHRLGAPEALRAAAIRAARHWAEQGTVRERALAQRLRGTGHELGGDWAAAEADYQAALSVFRSLDPGGEGAALGLGTLGVVALRRGDPARAEGYFREALVLWAKLRRPAATATAYANLAETLADQRRWAEAESLARKVIIDAQSPRGSVALAHHCLALVLEAGGHPAEALVHAGEAVELRRSLGHPELAVSLALFDRLRAAGSSG
ncbi:MAG TPA: tetratricopeptide repeat protein, partial [Myxococcota bacterium]|nr:tetratricopeptide repeat protein [Myxococcota bacterium]